MEEEDNQYHKTMGDYVNIFFRRKYYFLVTLILIAVIGTLVVFLLPIKYQSTAKILIESQQIPQDYIRSTITTFADERIEVIKQKVLTTSQSLEIIKNFNLYEDEKRDLSVSAITDLFRDNVEIQRLTANQGRAKVTIAFTLSFSDKNAKTAQEVTNKLVTLFLAENVKTRTQRASETTEFLLSESERIKEKMINMESLLSEFKSRNSESLPEYLELNMNKMERLENEYHSNISKITALKSKITFLQSELRLYSGSSSVSGAMTELDVLKEELASLQSTYTDGHPSVKKLKAQIKRLEQSGGSKPASVKRQANDQSVQARAQLYEAKAELEQTQLRQNDLENELKETEQRILKAPEVEKAYKELNRDYENMLEKYREIKNKELESRIAQNLEEEKKGERFTLLEPPLYPEEPNKPDRKKLLGGVAGIAFALGFGMVFLVEMLNPAVRGENEVQSIFGDFPLVTVPYIEIDDDIRLKKKKILITLLVLCLLFVLMLAGIHFFYMKLDLLWYTLLSRLSTF